MHCHRSRRGWERARGIVHFLKEVSFHVDQHVPSPPTFTLTLALTLPRLLRSHRLHLLQCQQSCCILLRFLQQQYPLRMGLRVALIQV